MTPIFLALLMKCGFFSSRLCYFINKSQYVGEGYLYTLARCFFNIKTSSKFRKKEDFTLIDYSEHTLAQAQGYVR